MTICLVLVPYARRVRWPIGRRALVEASPMVFRRCPPPRRSRRPQAPPSCSRTRHYQGRGHLLLPPATCVRSPRRRGAPAYVWNRRQSYPKFILGWPMDAHSPPSYDATGSVT
jgi:hypothetical protein